MKLLLDTHTFLWFITDDPKLSRRAKSVLENGDDDLLLSVASLWEMAIKVSIGKLILPVVFEALIPDELHENDIALLDLSLAHAIKVSKLPFHHNDPFDRLIIAQSLVENIPVVSSDVALDSYAIERIW